MSLQPRTTAPGKARRAASVGKPKRTKKAAEFKAVDPKARHTTAQKNARKGAAALNKSAVAKSGKAQFFIDVYLSSYIRCLLLHDCVGLKSDQTP